MTDLVSLPPMDSDEAAPILEAMERAIRDMAPVTPLVGAQYAYEAIRSFMPRDPEPTAPQQLLKGWSGYAWKDGAYVDDIQQYFDEHGAKSAPEPSADYRAIVERLLKDADNSDYTVGSCEELAWRAARDALNRGGDV